MRKIFCDRCGIETTEYRRRPGPDNKDFCEICCGEYDEICRIAREDLKVKIRNFMDNHNKEIKEE